MASCAAPQKTASGCVILIQKVAIVRIFVALHLRKDYIQPGPTEEDADAA
jgi:hypothetical protein